MCGCEKFLNKLFHDNSYKIAQGEKSKPFALFFSFLISKFSVMQHPSKSLLYIFLKVSICEHEMCSFV